MIRIDIYINAQSGSIIEGDSKGTKDATELEKSYDQGVKRTLIHIKKHLAGKTTNEN